MALSVIVYPGDGVRTQFNIPFALGYIKESDVTARVDGEVDGAGNQIYRTLVFLSPEIVEVQGTVVPVGTNIIFERTVVQDELIVDYEDGDVINEDNMNTSQKQMIMLVHQVLDGRFAQFQSGFDMGGFRITGLGNPVDPGDSANKQYVDGLISDGAANAAIAVAARDAAIAARNAAQASQSAASGSAGQAAASELNAANSASSAAASASAAAADRVQTGQDRVATGQDRVATAADRVQTGSDKVATGADRVQTGQDRVATGLDRTAANTSATNAASSAASAATARDNAWAWASKNENTQVDDGIRTGYSSYHWSAKAAASAAAAATFDPANYVNKTAGAGVQVMANTGLTAAPASGNAIYALRGGTGGQAVFDLTSGGRTREYDWRITVDTATERLNFVYNNGAASMFMNTDGNLWTSSYGWLNDRFAPNGNCRHEGGLVEFSGYDSGISDSVARCSSPFVQIGFRRGNVGLGGASFVQGVVIRNSGG